jgi:hypothetical protein
MYKKTYADTHALAVTSLYEGRGSGAPSNPTKVVNTLRQLEQWGRPALLHRKTKVMCFQGCGTQQVTDAFPNREVLLACGHSRPVTTMTQREYSELIAREAEAEEQRKADGWRKRQEAERKKEAASRFAEHRARFLATGEIDDEPCD